MARIYVAGPMRNQPERNAPLFDSVTAVLRRHGHTVFSPVEHTRQVLGQHDIPEQENLTREQLHAFMVADLDFIATANYVALLPGWMSSAGSAVEVAHARFLGVTPVTLPVLFDDTACRVLFGHA